MQQPQLASRSASLGSAGFLKPPLLEAAACSDPPATDLFSTVFKKSGAFAASNTVVLAELVFRPRRAKERSRKTNGKVIMLIEAKIQPERRPELVEAARKCLPLLRAEQGVEAFYLTVRNDDRNTSVFNEIYRLRAAQDFHLQQDFTKRFLATLKSAQAGERVRTNLVELDAETQTHCG